MNIRSFFHKWLCDEQGNVLVLAATSLIAMLGMAALAVDVSYVLTARNQLQSGVDASALAGAAGLLTSQTEATRLATDYAGRNRCINQALAVNAADITFPAARRIRVRSARQLPLFFAPILGLRTVTINAAAMAELGSLVGVRRLRPFAVPDGFPLHNPVLVKSGQLGAPATNPSFYYPVDYPPVNQGDPESGADVYRDNIAEGCDCIVRINDILQVEPGNMAGPTRQGVNDLIDTDANAYWDGSTVVNSGYSGLTSPRIVILPIYDPAYPPDSGRNTITVTGLAVFFIECISGGGDVYGRFIQRLSQGVWGNGNTFVYGVRLVE